MKNIFGSVHFNTIGTYLRKKFGCQISKLSLDAGFTCPNRDGTVGFGGCIYCSDDGAGHFAGDIPDQIELLSGKWPTGKYMAYFQSHTNTYAPVDILREKYLKALSHKDMVGIAIATRPDCLPDDVMDLLSELNKRTYLWVELGLQTKSDNTAKLINRCYPTSVFEEAMEKLTKANIKTVVHLIFGLPGEDRDDMMSSVDFVARHRPFGIKLHQLYIMENTPLAELYPEKIRVLEKDEYINLVVDALERLPQDITVHRLTGDAPEDSLIAPKWCLDKRSVLNGIQKEFKRRGTFQGYSL
ncbi:MAG: TIGR01212 family radical SAM protein [Clostridiales bacterium]|jgi:radical SAM protein (TIGR01212 family)|nr:TIGR01212 family radical SAM protein [Clostridiales bacterium]